MRDDRVIAQCLAVGIAPPEFQEVSGSTVVTFRVKVGATPQVTPQVIHSRSGEEPWL